MWIEIQKTHPVWYFDSSGDAIDDVVNEKKPYLYSIVTHDKINQKIICICLS